MATHFGISVIDFNDNVRCVRGRAVHKYIWSEKDSESFKRIKVLIKEVQEKKSRKINENLKDRIERKENTQEYKGDQIFLKPKWDTILVVC